VRRNGKAGLDKAQTGRREGEKNNGRRPGTTILKCANTNSRGGSTGKKNGISLSKDTRTRNQRLKLKRGLSRAKGRRGKKKNKP